MADANVIRDFFVALGFKTNDSEAGKMQETLLSTEAKAKLLNKALIGLGVAAVVGVAKTARELDKLHYASKRIGADAANVQAYGDAISQLGGDAESAVASLESVAQKIRNSPGYEEMIKGLGVVTRDENGGMRDRVEVLKDLSGTLSKMPHYQANAYAQSLGVDEDTLMAMRDGRFLSSMEKYQKLRKEMGMTDELAQAGSEFMVESRELGMTVKGVSEVLLMNAGKVLIPVLKLINRTIQGTIHWFSELNPTIKSTLGAGLKFAMLAVVFSGFLRSLMMLKKGLILLKSFIPVLKMLRLAFLASPLGIILALAAAIALLWDDYKTWKEGGKSLFDWSKWTGGIDKIIGKIKDFIEMLNKIKDKVINFIKKVIDDPVGAAVDVAEGAKAALDAVANSETVKGVIRAGQDFIEDVVENGVVDAVANAGTAIVEKGKGFFEGMVDNFIEVDQIKPNRQETPKNAADLAAFATAQGLNAIINTAKIVNDGAKAIAGTASSGGYAALGDIISRGEGNYDSVNRGLVNGKNLGSFETDLSGMTINQILERNKLKAGDKNRMNAVGKYQIIATTMKEAKKAMSLTGDERFTKEMQERIFKEFLVPKRKGLKDYLDGGKTSLAQAQYEAAMEWASIPVPQGYKTQTGKISDGTVTYYDKNGGNKAKKGQGEKIQTELMNIRNSKNINNVTAQSQPFNVNTYAPPVGNPEKSQTNNQPLSTSNITIHQNYHTEMTLNGVDSPVESANAVKRQQESSLAFMARGAKSIMG